MGLSYHFKIAAPAEKTPAQLEAFLKSVEASAKKMGFSPTLVLDARFDSKEKCDFARRITTGLFLENERLKGVVLPTNHQTWDHDPVAGSCRVIPERALILILTDEKRCETLFGFFHYPTAILDANKARGSSDRGVARMGIQRLRGQPGSEVLRNREDLRERRIR